MKKNLPSLCLLSVLIAAGGSVNNTWAMEENLASQQKAVKRIRIMSKCEKRLDTQGASPILEPKELKIMYKSKYWKVNDGQGNELQNICGRIAKKISTLALDRHGINIFEYSMKMLMGYIHR